MKLNALRFCKIKLPVLLGLLLSLLLALTSPALAQEGDQAAADDLDFLLRQAAREAFARRGSNDDFEVGLTRIEDDWALVNFRVIPPNEPDAPAWDVLLGLARWQDETWAVAIEGTTEFSDWLADTPESLIPAEARPYLENNVSIAGDYPPEFWLPFPLGITWKFLHGPYGGPRREAIDFAPFALDEPVDFSPPGSRERAVTAAANGFVIDRHRNLLILRHYGGWETGYYSLAESSLRHSLGQHLYHGDKIGLASNEGAPAKGIHLQFWVRRVGVDQPIGGLTFSGWQIFDDNPYETGPKFGKMVSPHNIIRVDCLTVGNNFLDHQACHITHLPPAKTKILFYPDSLKLKRGQIGLTSVKAVDVYGLGSVSIALRFDPTIVSVVDATPATTPTIEIAPGDIFTQAPVFTVTQNMVNNVLGRIEFEAELPPGAPFNGTGSLVDIAWRGEAAGDTPLELEEALLFDQHAFPISAPIGQGTITVFDIPHLLKLRGQVQLQGRKDHSLATIVVNNQQIQPGSTGNFQADTQPLYQISITAPGYLSARAESATPSATAQSINLGRVMLPGGDVTGDELIDIFDLALIGSRYGSRNAQADINGDGRVDIFDLTLAAANFGRRGPITQWQ